MEMKADPELEHITDVALRLFAVLGFDGTSTEMIAAAAGWDVAAAAPALDAAVARFQPAFDSYAAEVLERQRSKIARLPERQRQDRLTAAVNFSEMIRDTPRHVRSILERGGPNPPPPPPPMHR